MTTSDKPSIDDLATPAGMMGGVAYLASILGTLLLILRETGVLNAQQTNAIVETLKSNASNMPGAPFLVHTIAEIVTGLDPAAQGTEILRRAFGVIQGGKSEDCDEGGRRHD